MYCISLLYTEIYMYIYIDVCVCVCNRIHHVYAHFSSSAVVAHRQGKYLGPASVRQYSHYYSFHSLSPLPLPLPLSSLLSLSLLSLRSHRAALAKGLIILMSFFYYDYISLRLSPPFSFSLLPFSMFFYQCHKKTGIRIANERI